jgi:hypothetical protein
MQILRKHALFHLNLKYKQSMRMKPKFKNMNSTFIISVLKRMSVYTLSVHDYYFSVKEGTCSIFVHITWTGSLFVGKQPKRGVNHPPPSSAEVKERVELYLYSPYFTFTFTYNKDNECFVLINSLIQ